MTATSDLIQKLYIGYFGRAGDPSGLQYWVERKTAGMADAAIAQSFSVQTEATNMYGYLAAPSLGMGQDAFLEAVYQNLFERSIEAGGLTYWKGQLNAGRPVGSIILDIINGAVGSDATTVANKLSVANYYTEKVISANATWTLADDQADAISVIANVTSDTATVTTGRALADTLVAADTAAPAQSFTLTTGSNTGAAFTGGSGDDTFDGGLNNGNMTLTAGDQLNGGNGTDSLIATVNASVTPASISSIENVTLTATAASTVDFTNATGLSSISNQSSTAALTISGISKAVSVSVRDTSAAGQVIAYNNVTGSSDSATVGIQNVTGASTLTVAGVETLTLASSGTADNVIATLTTAAATRLNVTGTAALNVGTLGSTVSTLDASGHTGTGNGVTAIFANSSATTVTGGSGNDSFTLGSSAAADSINAGAGNDTITFSANFTVADSVNGGDGTDTLRATSADLVTASASTPTTYTVTNVETIQATTGLAAGASITAQNISASATRVNLAMTGGVIAAATGTVVGGAGAFTLGLGGSAAANTTGRLTNASTLTINDTGTGITDSLTITHSAVNSTTGLNIDVYDSSNIAVGGYETVTINSGSVAGGATSALGTVTVTGDVGGTSAETVRFTGSNNVTVGVITADIVDASALTAASGTVLTMVTGSTATSITGSAGNDTLFTNTSTSSSVAGGDGNDTITGGSGNDTILGQGGADSIDSGSGNDSVDGGLGNDTVVVSANANLNAFDTIVGGDGTDTLRFTAAVTDSADKMQAVSGFEVFELSAGAASTLTMSNFINNTGFTRIDFGDGAAGAGLVVNNVGSAVTDIRLLQGVDGDTLSFDRLVDTSSNSVSISARTTALNTVTLLTIDDEETVNYSSVDAAADVTITTLTAADLVTLNVSGAGDLIVTNAIGSTAIRTIDASAATGVVTLSAASATNTVTFTGAAGTANTFTGGVLADTMTGGTAADVLTGGAGADSIVALAGNDSVTGGTGADIINVGSGTDRLIFSADAESAVTTLVVGNTGTTVTLSGADVVTGMGSGDLIRVNGTGHILVGANANNTLLAAADLDITNGIVDNTFALIRGNYVQSGSTSGTGTFVQSASGADTLFIIDADQATAGQSFEATVLLGVTGITDTAAAAAGIVDITLALI